jgi:hypothetical protein
MKIRCAKRRPLTILACVLAAGIAAPVAAADTWAEVGDAGQLPSTAQIPFRLPPLFAVPLTEITGTLAGTSGADMYRICKIPGGLSTAQTDINPGTADDTQLFLFNNIGMGLLFNDDINGTRLSSLGNFVAPLGAYYLAVSAYNSDPVSVGGLIFPDTFPGIFGPTGPGGGSPIIGWVGTGGTGTYRITLTGWVFCPPMI